MRRTRSKACDALPASTTSARYCLHCAMRDGLAVWNITTFALLPSRMAAYATAAA